MAIREYGYNELYKLYITDQLSINRIAKITNASYEGVRRKIIRLKIPIRQRGSIYPAQVKFTITESYLREQYLQNKLSYKQIADNIGCSETRVYDYCKRFNIPSRHRSEYSYNFSIKHREKLSSAKQGKWSGDTNPNWKGGTSQDHYAIRKHITYSVFRRRVLRMKGDKCEHCGKNLIKICNCCGHKPDRHVHHPAKFADNPHLRFDLSNAVVLCEACHKSLHKK